MAPDLSDVVSLVARKAIKVFGECPDSRGYRHLIIVENNNHVGSEITGGIQRLECHASRKSAIADHGDNLVALLIDIPSGRDPQRGGEGGARMTGAEYIVLALFSTQKAADAPVFADSLELFASAGQQFVGIRLVPDIPDNSIAGGVKNVVQRDGKLDRAKVWRKVPRVFGQHREHILANLLSQGFELCEV